MLLQRHQPYLVDPNDDKIDIDLKVLKKSTFTELMDFIHCCNTANGDGKFC